MSPLTLLSKNEVIELRKRMVVIDAAKAKRAEINLLVAQNKQAVGGWLAADNDEDEDFSWSNLLCCPCIVLGLLCLPLFATSPTANTCEDPDLFKRTQSV